LKWNKNLSMVIMILILPRFMIVIFWIIVPTLINIIARIIISWIRIRILRQVLTRHPVNMMPVCVPPTVVLYPSRIRIFVLTFLNGIVNHGMVVMVVVLVVGTVILL